LTPTTNERQKNDKIFLGMEIKTGPVDVMTDPIGEHRNRGLIGCGCRFSLGPYATCTENYREKNYSFSLDIFSI
jgi:hypothetical protein